MGHHRVVCEALPPNILLAITVTWFKMWACSSSVKVRALLTALHTLPALFIFVWGCCWVWNVLGRHALRKNFWVSMKNLPHKRRQCYCLSSAFSCFCPSSSFCLWRLSLDNHSFKSSLNICVWFVALVLQGENCCKMDSDGTLKLTGAKHSCCPSKVLSLNVPGQLDPDVRLVGHFKADCKVCGCEHEWLSVFSPAFVTD